MSDTWEQIRQFLARLFSRGRHGVETVAETLDRQAKIQRLAGQVRTLARERNSLVVTIGKKVYALHTRGKVKNRDVLADCRRIDQIRDQIADLKRQIEEIRLASMGEMPPVDLEDESLLGEEEAVSEEEAHGEEVAPVEAPEVRESGTAEVLMVEVAAESEEPGAQEEESQAAAEA